MPDGVRVIGHYAFVTCDMALNTIVFPNTYDGITVNPDGTESFEGDKTIELAKVYDANNRKDGYIQISDKIEIKTIDSLMNKSN